ncbi:MAG TPA: methyltransferase domain-containing protein [Gammaproteobacteria bacterium]|nr:methyltransferase domain-containing protein [Gammaproteobacteria bacterium]
MEDYLRRDARPARMLLKRFDDKLHFFKSWIHSPRNTGAIIPTGARLARSMASIIRPDSELPVLELGPGTGAITRAILERGLHPRKLYGVEFSRSFVTKLKREYPGVNFIHGDAFHLDSALAGAEVERFDTVISALPLLNFPQWQRIRLIESLLDRLPPGRPVIQFSYGALSPVLANGGSYSVECYDRVLRNVPPAKVWLYRRSG